MARTNKTQFAILGCLSIKPMSAYDMKQFMARSTNYFWAEREGQLYPTLKQLTDQGLVDFEEVEAAKSGTKKIFQLTKNGHAALLDWLKQPAQPTPFRNEMLLKLFFGRNISTKDNIKHLEHTAAQCKENISILKHIKADALKRQTKADIRYYVLTIEYGIKTTQAELDWCLEAIISLQQEAAS